MKTIDRISLTMLLFLLTLPMLLAAGTDRLGAGETLVKVLATSEEETVLQFRIGSFASQDLEIHDRTWQQIYLGDEGNLELEGYPALPVINRSIIVADRAEMRLEVDDVVYEDVQLDIAPSKGPIARDIDPKTVPYRFADVYTRDEFYPSEIATLSEPYIMRDFRGITVKTIPFAYNPVSGTLRIFRSFKLRIYAEGESQTNTFERSRSGRTRDFDQLYSRHFINWQPQRYTPVEDSFGKLLVICYSDFMSAIQPYVNWKRQKGIETELIEFSGIGSTAEELQSYIQNRYNADPSIAYVQLVGDAPQIPTLIYNGGGSDPSFSLVAGSDNYPDIFVGRFSAENVAQLNAQVSKTIAYERDVTTSDTWLSKAVGITTANTASNPDNGESDIRHMDLIRDKLLDYGYTEVDQIYDPGATAEMVINSITDGRGVLNYLGHGSISTWATSRFNVNHASALDNGNMTPMIMNVACNTGNFVSASCLAEAWQRNPNGGSVTIYASSIKQFWTPPMRAQDEFIDLIVGEQKFTAGGLYYNSSCKMMDFYGGQGVSMFRTWHIFGDASLMARTQTPSPMSVNHPDTIAEGSEYLTVTTGVANALVALTYNNNIMARGYTDPAGSVTLTLSSLPAGEVTYTLTVTAHNRVTYINSLNQILPDAAWIVAQDASWRDNGDNQPAFGENGALSLKLRNLGLSASDTITLTLSSSTTGVSITNDTHQVTGIAAGGSVVIASAFGIQLADDLQSGSTLSFGVNIATGVQSWIYPFAFVVKAPVLTLGDLLVNDSSGNDSGTMEPGESLKLTITLTNNGTATSPAGTASLSTTTAGISIPTPTVNVPGIAPGRSRQLSFPISVAASVPEGSTASFEVAADIGAYGVSQQASFWVGAPAEVIIGTGTSTQQFPLNRQYNYSAHESLYLSSEIGVAGSINRIAYYKSGGYDIMPIRNVQIYMKHNDANSVYPGMLNTNGYTLVYDGNYPNSWRTGWIEVQLHYPFEYNGSSNLSILVVKGYQFRTSIYPRWRNTIQETDRRARAAQSNRQDNLYLSFSEHLPDIRLKVIPQVGAPELAVYPDALSQDQSRPVAVSLSLNHRSGAIHLSWDAVAGATRYRVYKAAEPYGKYELIGETADTYWNDSALANRAFYRVESRDR